MVLPFLLRVVAFTRSLVSFLLRRNRVVSSLSLLGSFIGRFGLLWTFASTSSYASKQSRSNPSCTLFEALYLFPFFRLQYPAVVPVHSFMGLLLTHGSTMLTLGPCLLGLGYGLLPNFRCQRCIQKNDPSSNHSSSTIKLYA